jgi:predicted ester cyclase
MPRRIVPVFVALLTVLIAGSVLTSGRPDSAAAQQASPTAGTPCPATSEEENAALVRRYYEEAYNARNPTLAHELLADQFVRHNEGAPHRDQAPGNTDDVARVEAWLTAFPDLHVTIEKIIATEDTVVVWNIWRGTQEGPLPPWDAPVTGQTMERESIIIYGVACGQLVENWIVQDNLTMLRQLGIITDEELADADTPTVATPVP